MHETSAQGWCTGMTQRDGMGREVGGGIRTGSPCKSTVDSCQCMAKKTLQYRKVISLQLKKIKEKKYSAVQKLLGLIGPTCLFLFLFSLL